MEEKGFKNPNSIVSKFNDAVDHGNKYLEFKELENDQKMTDELRNFGLDLGIASEWAAKYLVNFYCGGLYESEKVDFLTLWNNLNKDDTFKKRMKSLGFTCVKEKDAIYNGYTRQNIYNEVKHSASENVKWERAYDFYSELKRIISNFIVSDRTGSIKGLKTEEADIEDLFNTAEHFSKSSGYKYILLTDIHGMSEKDCATLFRIPWSMVLDMDPAYAEPGGMYYNYQNFDLGSERVINRYTLDDIISANSDAICWLTAAPEESKPDKAFSKIIARKSHDFFADFHKFNHAPVIVIAAAKNDNYTRSINKIIELMRSEYEYEDFTDDIRIIVLNNACAKIEKESDDYNIFEYNINMNEFIRGISKDIAAPVVYDGKYMMPSDIQDDKTQIYTELSNDNYQRLSEFAEPVYLGIENQKTDTAMLDPSEFYKGYEDITWKMVNDGNVAMKPSVFDECVSSIRKYLGSGGSNHFRIFYERGMGGTTLLKQIAFCFHKDYPTVMLKKYVAKSTCAELLKLYGACKKSILIIVDQNMVYDDEVDNLAKELKSYTCPFNMIHLKASEKKRRTGQFMPCLDKFDTEKDFDTLYNLISKYAAQTGLDSVNKDRKNISSPFLMNMYAFEDDFQGVERFVTNTMKRLEKNDDDATIKKQILFITALAGWSGEGAVVEESLFTDMYGIRFTNSLKIPGSDLNYLIAYQDKSFKMRHYQFSKAVLKIMSGSQGQVISFFNLTTSIIDFIKNTRKDRSITENDATIKLLMSLFIARNWEVTEELEHRDSYSRIIQKLIDKNPNNDDDRIVRVFETLIECYPQEVHFYAHYARYCFYTAKNYVNGHQVLEKAFNIVNVRKNGEKSLLALLYHIQGIGYRSEARAILKDIGKEKEHIGDQRYSRKDSIDNIRKSLNKVKVLCGYAEMSFSSSSRIGASNSVFSLIAECQLCSDVQRTYSELRKISAKFNTGELVGKDDYISNIVLLKNKYEELKVCSSFFESDKETDNDHKNTMKKIKEIEENVRELTMDEKEIIEYCEQCLNNGGIANKAIYRKIIAQRKYDRIESNTSSRESQEELVNIISLYEENIEEEPNNGAYIRSWFEAVRQLNCDEENAKKYLENFEDKLSVWIENGSATVEAYIYRYIVRFLRYFEENSLDSVEAEKALNTLLEEVKNKSADVIYKTNIIFWVSNIGHGLRRLLTNKEFYRMNDNERLETLQSFEGRLPNRDDFRGKTAYISMGRKYRIYFNPDSVNKRISESNAGGFVEFGLGFSYDGLRSYHDSIRLVEKKSVSRSYSSGDNVRIIVKHHNKSWVEGVVEDDASQPVIINRADIAKLYAVENDVWPKENEILDVKLTVIKTDYIMRKDIFGMQPLKKTFRAILCDDVCTASISK